MPKTDCSALTVIRLEQSVGLSVLYQRSDVTVWCKFVSNGLLQSARTCCNRHDRTTEHGQNRTSCNRCANGVVWRQQADIRMPFARLVPGRVVQKTISLNLH